MYIDISQASDGTTPSLGAKTLQHLERFDLIYRSLCAIMYNYVPRSGHPGGSISSGRLATNLVFRTMEYDIGNPDRPDADVVVYAAGHKALGLYALWALRNEIVRLARPDLLPSDVSQQLRLEDLLGFQRNPESETPLLKEFGTKALDGHPTPATPFVRLSTGPSGVGFGASLGLAFGARDYYGADSPRVHIIEGEGGLTPGRVAAAMASAGTSSLDNAILHVDWNQSSIDSDAVCREGNTPGDYVQWDPAEFACFHDWNAVFVPDGHDFRQIAGAQRCALAFDNGQPTAIVYRTVKGWCYGIEGRASHGAGHMLCSHEFREALADIAALCSEKELSRCDANMCRVGEDRVVLERCFWQALQLVRTVLESNMPFTEAMASMIAESKDSLDKRGRAPRAKAPDIERLYAAAARGVQDRPAELKVAPGSETTLRVELAKSLALLNRESKGALLVSSADLLGSTSLGTVAEGFAKGFMNCRSNPDSRQLSVGGICEDAIACVSTGISAFGRHVAVCSSYAAFMAPLGHLPARTHALANQMRQHIRKEPYKTFILVCAHASIETGEDGPTHADPQSLQLVQGNFAPGTAITLTPMDAVEVWPLLAYGLAQRPAVLIPFVNRPVLTVPDRDRLRLSPAAACTGGVYALRRSGGAGDGTLVLQGSGVAHEFTEKALLRLDANGFDLNIFYVSSAELFELRDPKEREEVFPDRCAHEAMGITGFTLPTMHRWIRSSWGLDCTLHPFRNGHYLGSGSWKDVMKEAGLDGENQYRAIVDYVNRRSSK